MTNHTTFGTLPDGATEIAVIGSYQYLRTDWVHRREASGQLEYYAPFSAWAETPAGQIGWRDTLIRDLQSRIAELEARLAEQASDDRATTITMHDLALLDLPVSNDRAAPEMAPAATPPAPPAEPEPRPRAGRVDCPYCEKRPWAVQLAEHIALRHPEHAEHSPPAAEAEEQPALPDPTTPLPERSADRRQALDAAQEQPDRPWSCATCGRSGQVVAKSLRDPSLCIQCAATQAIEVASNGHLVAA